MKGWRAERWLAQFQTCRAKYTCPDADWNRITLERCVIGATTPDGACPCEVDAAGRRVGGRRSHCARWLWGYSGSVSDVDECEERLKHLRRSRKTLARVLHMACACDILDGNVGPRAEAGGAP